MKKLFKLKDVLPNPYRDLKRFPIPPAKIETLMESIGTTGFWKNVGGREVDGKLQIASGHSRVEALRQKHKDEPSKEFEFNVEKLTDSDMLQMMARENKKIYAADLSAVIESVKAAITALSEGKIERGDGKGQMPLVLSKTKDDAIRYAPSFAAGVSSPKLGDHPYTVVTLAKYLGYTRPNGKGGLRQDHDVEAALAYLENEELKIPGWDAKTLETFRTPDGIIPVSRVAKAAEKVRQTSTAILAREKTNFVAVQLQAKSTQRMLDTLDAEKKANEAEQKRLLDARMAATLEEDKKKAEHIKQDQADNQRRQKENEAKRKIAVAEFARLQKERTDSLEHQRKAKEDAVRKAEACRAGFIKSLVNRVDARMSSEDALYDGLMGASKDKRTTEDEHKMINKALANYSERADDTRRFFSPKR